MELSGGVAVRLASLCLDPGGRLGDYLLWDTAVRGALLVDLAGAGRITHAPDSLTIDPTPTGFGPADRLLEAMAVEAEHSLQWWLDHGGVTLQDLAEENVAAGRWGVRPRLFGRRYADLYAELAGFDRARAGRPPDESWSEGTAAVVAIADAAGIVDPPPDPPRPEVLARTGSLRWLCEAVVEHLAETHRRNWIAAGGLFSL